MTTNKKAKKLIRARMKQSGTKYNVARQQLSASPPPPPPPVHVDVACPECRVLGVILGDGDPHCPQCGYTAAPTAFADGYVEHVMHVSRYEIAREGGDWPTHDCPHCDGTGTLVVLRGVYDDSAAVGYICFECGGQWRLRDLATCDGSRFTGQHLVFPRSLEAAICNSCLKEEYDAFA